MAFCNAVYAAELSHKGYGVQLRPDPSNLHDRNAIAVDGKVGAQSWHLGFLDRETAKEINIELILKGMPVAAELYNLWIGDDGYIDVKIIVLAPPGYSMSTRMRRQSGR